MLYTRPPRPPATTATAATAATAAKAATATAITTSADTWQRARDKAKVEKKLGLAEHPDFSHTSPLVEFRDKSGLVVARGYTRVRCGER